MSQGIREFSKGKSRMHAEKNVPSRVWEKVLIKWETRGNHHGIVLAHGIEKGASGIKGSWYCFGSWY